MAWLYQHPKTQIWKIGWRVGKKQFNRSTGTKDKSEAEKLFKISGIMVKANATNNLTEALFKSLTAQPVVRVAFKPVVEDYLARKAATTSAGTINAYRSAFNGLLKAVNATDESPALGDVAKKEVLQKYLAQLRSTCSAITCNNRVKYFGAFFREIDEKYHTGDPTKRMDRYHETAAEADEPDRRPFTVEEIRMIFHYAPNNFWRFAIKCGFFTAFRLGRIATLQWQHINFEQSTFDVKNTKPQIKKKLPVPILPEMLVELKSLRAFADDVQPTDYIFPDYATLYKTEGSAPLSREFHFKIMMPAGLHQAYATSKTKGKRKTNPITFHCLRHNNVTALKASGAPEMIARATAGHGSAAVSESYTHATSEMIRGHLTKIASPFEAEKDKKA